MTGTTSSILGHYGAEDLVNRIMRALAAAGYNTASPTVEMLNLVDQLHGGGLNSTKAQAEMIGVVKDMRVLDAGCGVGGSSRYLAHTYGCQVEAIDLTPQYVEAAVRLNELCGLDKKIVVRQGSVTDLPYADQSFDLVWCQNVTMNVGDKRRMFSEAYRVLAPSATLHDQSSSAGARRRAVLSASVGEGAFVQFSWSSRGNPRMFERGGIRQHRESDRIRCARKRKKRFGNEYHHGQRHARTSGQCGSFRK